MDASRHSKLSKRAKSLEEMVASHPLLQQQVQQGKAPQQAKHKQQKQSAEFVPLWERLRILQRRREVEQQLEAARREERAAKSLIMREELSCRQRVLKRLGYVDESGVVTMKGRVACELATGDELVLTELVFAGVFKPLTPEQCVALLSCFVWSEKNEFGTRVPEHLEPALTALREAAKRVGQVSSESKLPIDVDEYVASFRPELMEASAAWYRGVKFSEVLKLSNAFEGSMVRAIRRLEELLRQMASATKSIGEVDLAEKFDQCGERIKRDIVFAASLYL